MDSYDNELLLQRHPAPLLGREHELALARDRVLKGDARLVTLTGVAGVGKTRLAAAILEAVRGQITDVVIVDLTPITSPAEVLPTIARACGVTAGVPGQLRRLMAEAIGSRALLLVMDNCEHVLEAMPALSGLLSSCPNLKIIATSREILRLKWEWVMPVRPLEVPDLDTDLSPDAMAKVPSVALFVQRAQARNPDFALTPENAKPIAELCVGLDGIPLAIELAATQSGSLGVEALYEHPGRRLILDAQGYRDAPAHHLKLATAIDWSYARLDIQEKRLFCRLSVFSGGWSLRAAEQVCADGGLDVEKIPSLLGHLVDCSLVLARDRPGGGMRFRFPEIIREYATEELTKSAGRQATQRRHRDWYLAWAEEAEARSWGPGMPAWLQEVETELANFLTALEWSRNTPGEASAGVRMWAAISRFWDIRGHFAEGLALATGLLPLAPEHTTARARTLVQASILARSLGDGAGCRRMAEECLVLSRELNEVLSAAAALEVLGSLAQATGNLAQAEAIYAEAVSLARPHQDRDPRPLYITLFWQGFFCVLTGDGDRALAIFEEALPLARHQGDSNFIALILIGLGRTLLGKRDLQRASAVLLEGLRISRKLDYRELIAYCLDFLGAAAWLQQQQDRAIRLLGAAAAVRTRTGVTTWVPDPNYMQLASDIGHGALQAAQLHARVLSMDGAISWALAAEVPDRRPPRLGRGGPQVPDLLSPREMEIVELVSRGLGNREIAEKLYISTRTVDAHIRNILDKLGLDSRTQVSAWFSQHNLPR